MDNLSFLENGFKKNNISILINPFGIGSDSFDVYNAPKYLLKNGFKSALESMGSKVTLLPEISVSKKSFWDINGNKGKDVLSEISKNVENTSDIVEKEILAGNKIIALGGDHSISIGTVGGGANALKGDLGVIWIDSHGDINTFETSLSKNIHGMVVSTLLGIGNEDFTNLTKTKIKKENILYVGVKDLDQAEIDLMRKEKISVISMLDIAKYGLSIFEKEMNLLKKRVNNLWVSIDLDAIDKDFAPASVMATNGGLTYREITNIISVIGKSFNVVGIDIVEISPSKDIDGKTAQLCIELSASAFGGVYNWYSQYMDDYKKKK